MQQIVLEKEKLWQRLAVESSDRPPAVPKEFFFHVCAKMQLHINVWSYFQVCLRDVNGEKADTPPPPV